MNTVGLIFIFFAIIFAGFKFANTKLKYIEDLEEIKKFLQNFSHHISTYKTSIPKTVEDILYQNTYKNLFILSLAEEFKTTNSFLTAYEKSKEYISNKKIEYILSTLSSVIGQCDSNSQVIAIEQSCDSLNQLILDEASKNKSEAVLYKKLSLLSAILVVVMLY